MKTEPGTRHIRNAEPADYTEILEIYANARKFMAEHGNRGQWGEGYPPAELTAQDIRQKNLFVCTDGNTIQAVFWYRVYDDPTYREIDGEWLDSASYGVVHRIASAVNTRGAATVCLDWAFAQCGNLKIDTHADNLPMQCLLKKLGFRYCGIIRIEDGSPRRAYQKRRG